MKNLALFIISICLGYQAIAAIDPLILEVEKELNSIFKDTIDESESRAEVLHMNGEPQIKCSKLIYSKGRRMVFCSAEIKTSYGPDMNSHGQTACNSLGFILDKKGQIESQYNPENMQKCLEKIYDSSYD